MAEVLLNSLLQKLAEAALQKAINLYGISDKVDDVKAQLIDIKSYLKDADSKRNTSEVARNWVKNVRDVSFMIEDAIDTFLWTVESQREKEHGAFRNSVKWVVKGPKKLIAMNTLDGAINKIQAKIKKINENKLSFATIDAVASSSNLATVGSLYMASMVAPEDEKIDLVGFNKEKREIEELLLDQSALQRSVVFVVGIGGVGKTTLAKKVYQSVKEKFDFNIRLTVTKAFRKHELLKNILKKANENTTDEENYVTKVNQFLKDKKYFIVLDDVHSADVWALMKEALPDEGNRSRVLITTRNAENAFTAGIRNVCRLGFLQREESIKLLFKKAMPEENFNGKKYPPDLLEVAETAFKKCGGLPLALVVVGGRLSMRSRPTNYNDWKSVILTMNWLTDGKDCTKIFANSFEDLPVEHRSCFMYFASFPEDHEFSAEFITWLWIAEGFIPPSDEPGIMETLSKKYLDELARRCLIQVSKKALDGSISTFRVQNLLREFAIHEAKEKDFLNVISNKGDIPETSKSVRRVSSQINESNWNESSSEEIKFTETINPNIRTLLLFGKVVPFGPQFTLLRVLVVFHYNGHHGDPFPGSLIQTLKKLLQLRCLAFISCNFPWKVVLPIEHLHKLVTLVIRSCQDVVVPPRSLWGITTLRHVSVDRAYNFCDTLEGVSEPVDVRDLQILEEVKIDKHGINFLNAPNLFKLHLINERDSWEPIIAFLRNLKKLGFLTMQSMEIPLEILDMRNFPSYTRDLHTLRLKGRWQFEAGQLSAKMFPQYLNMLTLESSGLDENSFQVLEKLTSLRILVLVMAYAGKKMVCSNQGFCELKHLTLDGLKLVELEIEEGAMPKLEHLEIRSCSKLGMIPDLQRLKKLKVLSLKSMPENFRKMMNEEDNKHKIEKTRSINFDE